MTHRLELLAGLAALAGPAIPALELAPPAALLRVALREQVPTPQLEALARVVDGCIADDPAALADTGGLMALAGGRTLETFHIGINEILALRGLLTAGAAARGPVALRHPAAFSALRTLRVPPAPGHPPTIVVGTLSDGAELDLGHPPINHPLSRWIRLAFNSANQGPLLTVTTGSSGPGVPWKNDRERWAQPPGDIGVITAERRRDRCTISTIPQQEPCLIVGANLTVQLAPTAGTSLFTTTLQDHPQGRPLMVYIHAFDQLASGA